MTARVWGRRRRAAAPADKPHADTEQPANDWPGLPGWNAGGPVAGLEDELINLRHRLARVERELRDLSNQIDVRAQAARRQR